MIIRKTIAHALRCLAAVVEPTQPAAVELEPPPTEAHAESDDGDLQMAAADRMCAAIVLRRALRRYSPQEQPAQA